MFKSNHSSLNTHTGLSLIELMISIALSSLLMSVVIEAYLASRKSNELRIALHALQNNSKTAIDILNTEIRYAGYLGCAKLAKDFIVYAYPPYTLSDQDKITIQNENKITIKRADFQNVVLREMNPDNKTFITSEDVKFSAGDILIISNCQYAEIFVAERAFFKSGLQCIVATRTLKNVFLPGSAISRFVTHSYFVEKTKRKYNDKTEMVALYMQDIKGKKLELVEGVKAVKIKPNKNEASQTVGIDIHILLDSPPFIKEAYSYVAL